MGAAAWLAVDRKMNVLVASGGGAYLPSLLPHRCTQWPAFRCALASERCWFRPARFSLRLIVCREVVEACSDELAQALGSGDPERVAQACEDIAEMYQQVCGVPQGARGVLPAKRLVSVGDQAAMTAHQAYSMHGTCSQQMASPIPSQELGLTDEAVAAVKRADSPAKRVARLAGAMRRQAAAAGVLRLGAWSHKPNFKQTPLSKWSDWFGWAGQGWLPSCRVG